MAKVRDTKLELKNDISQLRNYLMFTFRFKSLYQNAWIQPSSNRTGYPPTFIGPPFLSGETKVILSYHVFDDEQAITSINLEYELNIFLKSGGFVSSTVLKKDVSSIGKVRGDHIVELDKELMLKDFESNVGDILALNIRVRQTSLASMKNESELYVILEFKQS